MRTSKHGQERVRKRIGIKKRAVDKMRDFAFGKGVSHQQATGRLNKFFTWLYFRHETATNIRMYSNYVWIFAGDVLVTVFPVPKEHFKSVLKIQKRINILASAPLNNT